MADSDRQLPWTDDQWNKVRQVVYEEARRARVAGNVLPLFGPLDPDVQFVAAQKVEYDSDNRVITIPDRDSLRLLTIEEKIYLRGAQIADPDLDSAMIAFRNAANRIARREDVIIFKGGNDHEGSGTQTPKPFDQSGLVDSAQIKISVTRPRSPDALGETLLVAVSNAIAELEEKNHLGPFACMLGHEYFRGVQTPTPSMVLPQDRLLPFLGGGALVRTSVLDREEGLVVALGGAPIDLVVATDISVKFLQVTTDAKYVFRVYEKIVLRVKQPTAIAHLTFGRRPPAARSSAAKVAGKPANKAVMSSTAKRSRKPPGNKKS